MSETPEAKRPRLGAAQTPRLATGGARGADAAWAAAAAAAGWAVRVHSFRGHHLDAAALPAAAELVLLADARNEAVARLAACAEALRRPLPASPYVRSLLRRNLAIAAEADMLLIADVVHTNKPFPQGVRGGAAWVAAGFADRPHAVRVFDQRSERWLRPVAHRWIAEDASGVVAAVAATVVASATAPATIAGVGSRELTVAGTRAIAWVVKEAAQAAGTAAQAAETAGTGAQAAGTGAQAAETAAREAETGEQAAQAAGTRGQEAGTGAREAETRTQAAQAAGTGAQAAETRAQAAGTAAQDADTRGQDAEAAGEGAANEARVFP